MVKIIKANGEKVTFDRGKAVYSCINSGASCSDADVIVEKVEGQLKDGMSTRDLKEMILAELKVLDKHSARRYLLREAVSKLDPSTHQFEMYISNLFIYHGYKTVWEPKPKPIGCCTDHEIDVSIEKDGDMGFIECKHHYNFHRFTGLAVPMVVWSRLDDLKSGYCAGVNNSFPFSYAWVLTNTKVSRHAIDYAKCKNIKITGWNYPPNCGLNHLIESVGAYPLSLLIGAKASVVDRFFDKGIYDTIQFQDADADVIAECGIPHNEIEKLKEFAKGLKKSLGNSC